MKKVICSTGEVCKTYQQYLNSAHWKAKKEAFRTATNSKLQCYICGNTNHINVHHRSYKNIGNEANGDLVELCRDCHLELHLLVKSTRKIDKWKCFIDLCFAVEFLKSQRKKKKYYKKAAPKIKRIAGIIFPA